MDRIDKWIEFYRSSNPDVRKRALAALAALATSDDPRVIPILLDAFDKIGPHVAIVKAMQRSEDRALVKPMLVYLTHPDPNRRKAACDVLGALKDKEATMPLVERLTDDNIWVRRQAAFALAFIGDPRATDALMRRYAESQNEDINVRIGLEAALNALGATYEKHKR